MTQKLCGKNFVGTISDRPMLKSNCIRMKNDSRVPITMTSNGFRHAVMAPYPLEVTTDVPEHAFLADDANTDWDERARGLGATMAIPVGSSAEENILCHVDDRPDYVYYGQI